MTLDHQQQPLDLLLHSVWFVKKDVAWLQNEFCVFASFVFVCCVWAMYLPCATKESTGIMNLFRLEFHFFL